MIKDMHPPVFMVDTHATRPPLPPRLGQRKQQIGPAQTLLFMLVSVALCAIAIEACLLYNLYQRGSDASASSSKQSGDAELVPTALSGRDIPPSKPVAHLTDGSDVVHKPHIMAWSTVSEPLVYDMTYDIDTGALIIQKTGYYFVYTKVFFKNNNVFHHSVVRNTVKYTGGITLLQSRTYSKAHNPISRSNSYLGGVFYLEKDDSIYVNVSSTEKIERHASYENVFGAYMI